MSVQYLLVNFGGPRDLEEIPSFLQALLRDQDVIRTNLPYPIHHFIFGRVAKRRAKKIAVDYEKIGGKSPIYEDTEALKKELSCKVDSEVLTFHRYLPSTHKESLKKIEKTSAEKIIVFPLFPQFSYATTGSIARFFGKTLSKKTLEKMHWIKSYSNNEPFIKAHIEKIKEHMKMKSINEDELILLFSAHGLPKKFVRDGDPYQKECEESFSLISKAFPKAISKLSYQSKFGPGEWLRPYTEEFCKEVKDWGEGRKKLLMVPLSFTSDHIETLFEMEDLYLPLLQKEGIEASRVDALTLSKPWIDAIHSMLDKPQETYQNHQLIRQ